MAAEDAIAYALLEQVADRAAIPMPEESPAGVQRAALTALEREVAFLVARGLTNRQIAGEHSISGRTTGNHVARILKKLGLRSRAQVAT